jgi:hypothetical protein
MLFHPPRRCDRARLRLDRFMSWPHTYPVGTPGARGLTEKERASAEGDGSAELRREDSRRSSLERGKPESDAQSVPTGGVSRPTIREDPIHRCCLVRVHRLQRRRNPTGSISDSTWTARNPGRHQFGFRSPGHTKTGHARRFGLTEQARPDAEGSDGDVGELAGRRSRISRALPGIAASAGRCEPILRVVAWASRRATLAVVLERSAPESRKPGSAVNPSPLRTAPW